VADDGLNGLGKQGAAAAIAAQLTPVCDALHWATASGVPDTVGRQGFTIGFDRTCQAPAHEAL